MGENNIYETSEWNFKWEIKEREIINKALEYERKQNTIKELKRFKQILIRLRKGHIRNNYLELDKIIEQIINRLKRLKGETK